jgi:uncharacterized RDD family membrane protein YckC
MPYCKKCGNEIPEGTTYCPKCGSPVESVAKLELATWGERFVGWLIDIVILNIAIWPMRMLLQASWPTLTWATGFPTWIPFVDFGLSNVLHFLYWTIMEGTYGQSFGKMIMKIEVTRLDGKPADIARAAIESIGKAYLLPLDCIVGWLLYPRKGQRIFNYLSETVVVRIRR